MYVTLSAVPTFYVGAKSKGLEEVFCAKGASLPAAGRRLWRETSFVPTGRDSLPARRFRFSESCTAGQAGAQTDKVFLYL
ncbi:MAG: hypothetical protein HY276_00370 [Ignavibacteriales bacterium]|nr:hypothetical protein [Ignavibacteriales bacterium]